MVDRKTEQDAIQEERLGNAATANGLILKARGHYRAAEAIRRAIPNSAANDPGPFLYAAAVLEGQAAEAFAVCKVQDASDLKHIADLLRKTASEMV